MTWQIPINQRSCAMLLLCFHPLAQIFFLRKEGHCSIYIWIYKNIYTACPTTCSHMSVTDQVRGCVTVLVASSCLRPRSEGQLAELSSGSAAVRRWSCAGPGFAWDGGATERWVLLDHGGLRARSDACSAPGNAPSRHGRFHKGTFYLNEKLLKVLKLKGNQKRKNPGFVAKIRL